MVMVSRVNMMISGIRSVTSFLYTRVLQECYKDVASVLQVQ
jgi:hypothetical protein